MNETTEIVMILGCCIQMFFAGFMLGLRIGREAKKKEEAHDA